MVLIKNYIYRFVIIDVLFRKRGVIDNLISTKSPVNNDKDLFVTSPTCLSKNRYYQTGSSLSIYYLLRTVYYKSKKKKINLHK